MTNNNLKYELCYPEDGWSINGRNCLEGTKNYNLFRIQSENKIGVFDIDTREIVYNCELDSIVYFDTHYDSNNAMTRLYIISKNGLCGILNSNLEILVPLKYELIKRLGWSDEFYFFKKNENWGAIDRNFKEVISPIYKTISGFDKYGFSIVSKDVQDTANKQKQLFGFLNIEGQEVISCKYDSVEAFKGNGKARVVKNNKYGFVSMVGEEFWE